MKLLILLFLGAGLHVSGQIVDINPNDTNPIYIDPLDMSQVALPVDQLPITIFIGWSNPVVFSNEFTVMGCTVDFQTWYRAYDAPALSNAVVEVVSSNTQTFFRVGNQFGP